MAGEEEEEEEKGSSLEMSWQRANPGWLLFKNINISCTPTYVRKVSFFHEHTLTTASRNLRPSRLSMPSCFKLTE